MNDKEIPKYSENDPCVDLFYSHKEKVLCFSARILTRENGGMDGEQTIFPSLPTDSELGTILQQRLKSRRIKVNQTLDEIVQERAESDIPTITLSEPDYVYWAFVVWTKPHKGTPFILGTPFSNYYDIPIRFMTREATAAELGRAVKQLIYDVSLHLMRAGLSAWKDAARKGTWLSQSLQPSVTD